MNATPLQMADRIAPDAPIVPILAVCDGLDRSRTNSVDSVVEEIKRLMTLAGLECKAQPCEILSALVNDTLLSDDTDPCHVYGLDFIKACDKAMCQSHE
tara:strand:- start:34430 stop:34726 length:297 start_codon:yes stop_codon:yes gene_type:complete